MPPTTALTLAQALAAEAVIFNPPRTPTEIRAYWRRLVPEQRRHLQRRAERILLLLRAMGPEGDEARG